MTSMSSTEMMHGNFSETTIVSTLTLAQRRKIVNRNYYQRSKENNKYFVDEVVYQESTMIGEECMRCMTNITNISPNEMIQGDISETTPVSALTLAQKRKIVNRDYYQRNKEKKKIVVNTQGTSVVGSEGIQNMREIPLPLFDEVMNQASTIGEGSSQSISLMETIQGNISETVPESVLLVFGLKAMTTSLHTRETLLSMRGPTIVKKLNLTMVAMILWRILFFPNGESGWHARIPRHGVCIDEIINEDENLDEDLKGLIHSKCDSIGGRLFQQFMVDMYIKIETARLSFIERNQTKIRSDLYQGVVDCFNAGEVQPSRVGQWVMLPASFIGGPRDMRRRYMDAMTLVQDDGKPDIFLTMT
ncbi:hypothetical protein OSB04_011799 [Centaurea solstitialis]|uniref:Helitron helicase-like domain-containing protein n=1 Tax=Centaurea solstitialis TaxID=347529 RepID=A0AA38TLV7_9ASTR|nr:hypothetical protein OSB04_011799 [Centaurea solstitialis]